MKERKYNNILWVEDNPCSTWLHVQSPERRRDLSERVKFAYSYEMGRRALEKGNEFDLVVLDADFPDNVSDVRERHLNEYVQKLLDGQKVELHEMVFGRERGVVNSNFRYFVRDFLIGKKNIVVYSSSDTAAGEAWMMGLPFFSKRVDGLNEVIQMREEVISKMQREIVGVPREVEVNSDITGIEDWEVGGFEELSERYLFAIKSL